MAKKIVRYYIFKWYETKGAKYGNPIIRTNKITLSHPSGETAVDAKVAVNIFITTYGNLNCNTIVSIKEMNENGQIGEDIIPSEDNSIIPSNK